MAFFNKDKEENVRPLSEKEIQEKLYGSYRKGSGMIGEKKKYKKNEGEPEAEEKENGESTSTAVSEEDLFTGEKPRDGGDASGQPEEDSAAGAEIHGAGEEAEMDRESTEDNTDPEDNEYVSEGNDFDSTNYDSDESSDDSPELAEPEDNVSETGALASDDEESEEIVEPEENEEIEGDSEQEYQTEEGEAEPEFAGEEDNEETREEGIVEGTENEPEPAQSREDIEGQDLSDEPEDDSEDLIAEAEEEDRPDEEPQEESRSEGSELALEFEREAKDAGEDLNAREEEVLGYEEDDDDERESGMKNFAASMRGGLIAFGAATKVFSREKLSPFLKELKFNLLDGLDNFLDRAIPVMRRLPIKNLFIIGLVVFLAISGYKAWNKFSKNRLNMPASVDEGFYVGAEPGQPDSESAQVSSADVTSEEAGGAGEGGDAILIDGSMDTRGEETGLAGGDGSGGGRDMSPPVDSNKKYVIQVCVYPRSGYADKLVVRLEKLGFNSFYDKVKSSRGKEFYRVFIGRYENSSEARREMEKFQSVVESDDFKDSFVRILK